MASLRTRLHASLARFCLPSRPLFPTHTTSCRLFSLLSPIQSSLPSPLFSRSLLTAAHIKSKQKPSIKESRKPTRRAGKKFREKLEQRREQYRSKRFTPKDEEEEDGEDEKKDRVSEYIDGKLVNHTSIRSQEVVSSREMNKYLAKREEEREIATQTASEGQFSQMFHDPNHMRAVNEMLYLSGREGEYIDTKAKLKEMSPFAEDFFAQKKPRNLHSYNQLLRIQAVHKMPTHALQAFEDMLKRGIQPNLKTYTALASACASQGLTDTAFSLLGHMKKFQLKPDLVFFGALMSSCAEAADVEKGFEVMDLILESRLQPNLVIFTSLIQTCVNAKQLDKAWDVFYKMQRDYKQPDLTMYKILLQACAKGHEAERALNVYSELQLHRIQPDTMTYCLLIRSLANRKDYYLKAFELFEQMKASGIKPNVHVFSSLLYVCARQNDLETSLQVWQLMGKMKVVRTPIAYNAMLNALALSQTKEIVKTAQYGELSHGKRIQMASHIVQEMKEQGFAIQSDTLNLALNTLTIANRVTEAFDFVRQMYPAHQVEPDQYTYMALLRMCNNTRLLEKGVLVMDAMKQANIKPQFEAYCIILRLFAEIQDREGAEPYLQEMKEHGYRLKSRSMRLSIPSFFTMSEEKRATRNEIPYHGAAPLYPHE